MATAINIVRRFFPNVTTVKDSNRSIEIEVTSRDAQSQAVKNHKECALAHACKRALKVDGAIICVKTAYLVEGDTALRFTLPESVSREITSFDRKAGFQTGKYQLCKVSPASRLGIGRGKPTRNDKPKFKKTPPHRTENIRHVMERV